MTTDQVLLDTLRAMAGPAAAPRSGQQEAVRALVDEARRVLVVQATGWGKSLVYWAATSAIRQRGGGPTVVVSPLLALMRDQIAAAQAAGLVAATVNSANLTEWTAVFDQLAADQIDVLLVSPERLANPQFADRALPLLQRTGLLVIDEAHCISDWGFDFRPDYQRVTNLLLAMRPGTPVLATTATANRRVTADVATQLGPDTVVQRGPLARSSLQLSVVAGLSAVQRYAWVGEALATFPGSGIVYGLTVRDVEGLTAYLTESGHTVAAYTGQTPTDERAAIEDQLRRNELKAVVATSALGMGYDKPDLAFCIHVGSPSSPVAYYQQVGRAGRQLDSAHGVLLPAAEADERIWDYFATATLPDPDAARRVLAVLRDQTLSVPGIEAATGLRRGRLELLLKQLRVDGAVDRDGSGWRSTGREWVFDEAKYAGVVAARRDEADLMRRYAAGSQCLMQVLIEALDDPAAAPCGRCSVCTGVIPAPGTAPSVEAAGAAASFLRRAQHGVEPRKLWPSGIGLRGRIQGAADGRALAYADDPGWGFVIAELQTPDAAPSPELVAATADLLFRWRPARPDVIVPLPEPNQQRRMAGLADALGERFSLPVAAPLQWDGSSLPGELNSADTVTQLQRRLSLSVGADRVSGHVLLLAATTRTRWTLTLAAALLRDSGAAAVSPLVLHRLP